MVALVEQIAAFKQQLPRLRQDHGSSWAVLVDSQFRAAFPDFQRAAAFAVANFAGQELLIRHTDEVTESLPLVFVED